MSFSNFVNRVLLQHSLRNSRSIHKFYLANNYSKFDVYDVESWVITMISRGVQEIEIELKVYDPSCRLFILPPSVFISKTLVVLNLCGFIMSLAQSASRI
ncbi:hypothetical protein ACH5RR_037678 [Cinchona calisaya]|uniref:Uncharacterized protein n=1 Tax=Cinchona calisaya TaxID=153742 RepID=A0ABD2YAK9_9GENT